MRITFDLPDPAAQLLLRLMDHLNQHSAVAADSNTLCRSMIVDLLIDDAVAHRTAPGSDRLQ